jgi:hypothetical protein
VDDIVTYADGDDASAFGQMLGGLIQANVGASADRRKDFDAMKALVGVYVTDIEEGVTLDFNRGHLVVSNGLHAARDVTIRADSETVMTLSNLKIGLGGMPNYFDASGREVVGKMLRGKLKIEGLLGNVTTLNQVTRLFSVQ